MRKEKFMEEVKDILGVYEYLASTDVKTTHWASENEIALRLDFTEYAVRDYGSGIDSYAMANFRFVEGWLADNPRCKWIKEWNPYNAYRCFVIFHDDMPSDSVYYLEVLDWLYALKNYSVLSDDILSEVEEELLEPLVTEWTHTYLPRMMIDKTGWESWELVDNEYLEEVFYDMCRDAHDWPRYNGGYWIVDNIDTILDKWPGADRDVVVRFGVLRGRHVCQDEFNKYAPMGVDKLIERVKEMEFASRENVIPESFTAMNNVPNELRDEMYEAYDEAVVLGAEQEISVLAKEYWVR